MAKHRIGYVQRHILETLSIPSTHGYREKDILKVFGFTRDQSKGREHHFYISNWNTMDPEIKSKQRSSVLAIAYCLRKLLERKLIGRRRTSNSHWGSRAYYAYYITESGQAFLRNEPTPIDYCAKTTIEKPTKQIQIMPEKLKAKIKIRLPEEESSTVYPKYSSIKIGEFATSKSDIDSYNNLIVCRVYDDPGKCTFICISEPNKTWTMDKDAYMNKRLNFTPLPAGTVITLTVNQND